MVDAASQAASSDCLYRDTPCCFSGWDERSVPENGAKSTQSFSSLNQTDLPFFLHMHGQTHTTTMHIWRDLYGHVASYDFTPQVTQFTNLKVSLHSALFFPSLSSSSSSIPFLSAHLKLLLLSVDSFARLKKRSRITE